MGIIYKEAVLPFGYSEHYIKLIDNQSVLIYMQYFYPSSVQFLSYELTSVAMFWPQFATHDDDWYAL